MCGNWRDTELRLCSCSVRTGELVCGIENDDETGLLTLYFHSAFMAEHTSGSGVIPGLMNDLWHSRIWGEDWRAKIGQLAGMLWRRMAVPRRGVCVGGAGTSRGLSNFGLTFRDLFITPEGSSLLWSSYSCKPAHLSQFPSPPSCHYLWNQHSHLLCSSSCPPAWVSCFLKSHLLSLLPSLLHFL